MAELAAVATQVLGERPRRTGWSLPVSQAYGGPVSDHFDGERFFNPGQPGTDRSLAELLRWRLLGRRTPWGTDLPAAVVKPEPRVDGVAITLVGHASVLVQMAGQNLLVDPVWSLRASPFGFAGPRRADAPGVAFADLPAIDAVLLTHNHYDHLDVATLARLEARHRPRFIAPLGNEGLIRGVVGGAAAGARVEVGDWGQRFAVGSVEVTLHPAYHWSARGMGDRRRALWCGFVMAAGLGAVYLAGDTGYGDGAPFRLVRERFGAPLAAVLPIGAYEPRWFMRAQHVNPAEAVQILQDCGAAQGLGVHWGTFRLTDEGRDAPRSALAAACRQQGIVAGRFRAMRPGDVWRGGPG